MARVRVTGNWLSGEEEIKEGVTNAFSHLFTKNGDRRPSINLNFLLAVLV